VAWFGFEGPFDFRCFLTEGTADQVYAVADSEGGGAQRIKSIPDGLQIIQRGNRMEHFEIVPKQPMEIERFQQLLGQVVFE
jgi:hypothetical protein